MHARRPVLGLVAHSASATTTGLVRACNRLDLDARELTPQRALAELRPGDIALGRLDVRLSLDGVEPGLWELRVLEREGVRVLNRAAALVATHDKLATSEHLRGAVLPHPATVHVDAADALPSLPPPLVLKPRFGSWGRDVVLCEDDEAVAAALTGLSRRPWFAATGAVAQQLVPPQGFDLRVVVAGGVVVGAVERVAAPGEWRTNVALGGARRSVDPSDEACLLATAAAAAVGADLAGVDLAPLPGGGWTVIEVNGAVDFTRQYRRQGDVFEAVVEALAEPAEAAITA